MKKIIVVALLSAVVAAPAWSDETASPIKPAISSPSMHKSPVNKVSPIEGCDEEHAMKNHHEGNMMDEEAFEMMAKPDMHMLGALGLGKEQESKIKKLADELKHNNWAIQGLINDETAKLRDLYEATKRDPIAIGKEYLKIFDLKRQMIESDLDTQNHVEEILTPEQLAKIKGFRKEMHHMHPMNE